MAMGGIDHQEVDAGVDQALGALEARIADRGRRGGAEPALRVLGGVRVELRLLHVLDGDEADAAILIVDDDQLLDAVLVKQLLGLGLADRLAHRDQVLARHQLIDALLRVGGEADVAVGQDADQAAEVVAASAAAVDDRDARDAVGLHQRQRVGKGGIRADHDRVHDHAALELLDLADLLGLLFRREVAVDDADAAGLRHGDGEAGLGHCVHGGGDDRQVELDLARDPRPEIGLAGQHLRVTRQQQHVVEGERLAARPRFVEDRHRQLPLVRK